jgi:hypothetical protein
MPKKRREQGVVARDKTPSRPYHRFLALLSITQFILMSVTVAVYKSLLIY